MTTESQSKRAGYDAPIEANVQKPVLLSEFNRSAKGNANWQDTDSADYLIRQQQQKENTMKHNQSEPISNQVNRETQRYLMSRLANLNAIREHYGKFYHIPSGEYISKQDALKCQFANIELH